MSTLKLEDVLPELPAIEALFSAMEVAEDEIAAARGGRRDKDDADPLWRSFMLVRPTHERMTGAEWVYRAHCRELLARVAAGEDTRPATDVEIALGLMEASLEAPSSSSLAGLYFRVFKRAFPKQYERVFADGAANADDYEKVHGTQIDEHDAWTRRKLAQGWRVLPRPAEA